MNYLPIGNENDNISDCQTTFCKCPRGPPELLYCIHCRVINTRIYPPPPPADIISTKHTLHGSLRVLRSSHE